MITLRTAPTEKRRLLRYLRRFAIVLTAFFALYILAVWILGAIAVNTDWREVEDGIEIAVMSNGRHVDLVLPVKHELQDWSALAPLDGGRDAHRNATHVTIGWGDRKFYIETPTPEHLRYATVARAFFLPTATAMHLAYYHWLPIDGERCVRLKLRPEEYRRVVDFVKASFRLDEQGRAIPIAGKNYQQHDGFFEGTGRFHLFRTCNNWANDGLSRAGVRTPVWSPFQGAILERLRER